MKDNNKITLNLADIKSILIRLFSDKRRLGRTILVLIVLIAALGIRLHNLNAEETQVDLSSTDNEQTAVEMYVDISGEVKNPGVYIVNDGTRLYEVIEKAGGLTNKANTDQINQAGYVEDGEKIVIPSIEDESAIQSNTPTSSNNKTTSNGLVNINTASKEELMNITGVGEVIADRIIEYRKGNRFKSTEDIMNVNGIGNATYEKMKSEITV